MDLELEFDKNCLASSSPNTVLPLLAPKTSTIHKNNSNQRRRDQSLVVEQDSTTTNNIRFESHTYKSVSSRITPSTSRLRTSSSVVTRGSVYQNSIEVMQMHKMFNNSSRTKIEIPRTNAKLDTSYQDSASESDGVIDIVFGNRLCGDLSYNRVEDVTSPMNDGNVLNEEHEFRESTRFSSSRFSRIQKLMDPFLKSMSHKSHSSFERSVRNDENNETLSSHVLHACLTLKTKDEIPLLEFTMKSSEGNFLARIWKRNSNDGDCVYTFHSVRSRNRHRWGSSEEIKELPILGQMQVTSRLCSESNVIAEKSLMTEFVMYDLVSSMRDSSDSITNAYAREPVTLRPSMETAAIVIRIPLEKGEGSKNTSEFLICENVVVVTPVGSHGVPDAENQGPSSLLDRWRLGGGCECGGWDIGCPVTVYTNHVIPHELVRIQERECEKSALSMKVIGDGKYDVTFHARFSGLQAFSIAVAMLHGTEVSLKSQSSPRKQLVEHELELLEAFNMEDSKQIRSLKKESHMSFAVNPPFSPISRV